MKTTSAKLTLGLLLSGLVSTLAENFSAEELTDRATTAARSRR